MQPPLAIFLFCEKEKPMFGKIKINFSKLSPNKSINFTESSLFALSFGRYRLYIAGKILFF